LNTFTEAARQFQLIESVDGDGDATLGIAQVNLGQQNWDVAIEQSDAALLRYRQANDLAGQARALLTKGLAHRGKDELDMAITQLEEALHLYHQLRQPLGVADTRAARGGIYLLRGDLERAHDEQSKAIAQVEHVMQTLSTPQQWGTFLRQYAELYAEAAITLIKRNMDEQAHTLLQNFARIAGSEALQRPIKTYEQALPISGDDLPEEELQANQDFIKRLEQTLKGL